MPWESASQSAQDNFQCGRRSGQKRRPRGTGHRSVLQWRWRQEQKPKAISKDKTQHATLSTSVGRTSPVEALTWKTSLRSDAQVYHPKAQLILRARRLTTLQWATSSWSKRLWRSATAALSRAATAAATMWSTCEAVLSQAPVFQHHRLKIDALLRTEAASVLVCSFEVGICSSSTDRFVHCLRKRLASQGKVECGRCPFQARYKDVSRAPAGQVTFWPAWKQQARPFFFWIQASPVNPGVHHITDGIVA